MSSASPSRRRWLVARTTASRRATASGSSHGSSMNRNAMRLPVASSSPARTSTGTIALSARGSSPRRSWKRAQRAGAGGEDDVVGRAAERRRTARRSSSGRVTRTWWRCAAPSTLSAERRRGRQHGVAASARRAPRPGAAHEPGARAQRRERERGARRRRGRRARAPSRSGADGGGARDQPPRSSRLGTVGLAVEHQVRELASRRRRRPCSGAPCRRSRSRRRAARRGRHMSHSGRSRSSGNDSTRSTSASSVLAGLARVQVVVGVERRRRPPTSGSCTPSGTSSEPLAPARRVLQPRGDRASRSSSKSAAARPRAGRTPPPIRRASASRASRPRGTTRRGRRGAGQGAGTGRIMIRFVPPVVPSWPAVITTSAPGGRPA